MEHENKSDHDLLVMVVNDMCWVKKTMKDHLAHHSRLFFAGLSVIGTLLVAMVLLILTQ